MTINQFLDGRTEIFIFQQRIIQIPNTRAAFDPGRDIKNKRNEIMIGNRTG